MSRETSAGVATVTQLCAAFGISRAAYYAAKKAARPAAKVIAIRRAPRHTSSEVALAAIREVIKAEPAWGVRKVWATLQRKGLKVSRKRVHALMRANGLVLARDREPGETTRGHVAVPEPNRRFGGDLTTVWTRRDGWVAVVPTIDCGCRSVLGLTVTKDQHGPAVLVSVEQALREAFGDPKYVPDGVELRTDHGPQYTGADCAALVAKWGIVHTFAPVGRPTGNAVAERLIRTMKEEVVWLRDWETADELLEALLAWQCRYNTERPHQALGWKTPAEYRDEKLGLVVEEAA
jgi:transposase InsO family protein